MYLEYGWGYGNMPQGLQCFDANGVLKLDITDRVTKLLGSFTTTKVAGSIQDPNITLGNFWYVGVPIIENGDFTDFLWQGYGRKKSQLVVVASGSTISWLSSNGFYDGYTRAQRIWYGVY